MLIVTLVTFQAQIMKRGGRKVQQGTALKPARPKVPTASAPFIELPQRTWKNGEEGTIKCRNTNTETEDHSLDLMAYGSWTGPDRILCTTSP